ncbi:hypothetical protein CI789_02565 [Erwinia persicina]|uniref:hypothetical protein n=1 Tax=Erwinia persicina TaxID=55211 RepID=UPI000E4971B1|nr:hypothetical protein [Erwinia persicina]AXU94208.1 hypothetical protein CI789_02565 [Erwinia persicina]
MKEFKGTPGRWDVGMNGEILSDAGHIVMGTDLVHGNEHDLDLASSAPELLSALQELLIDIRIAQGNMRDAAKKDKRWEGCAESFQSRVDAADLAIAKALGESQ